MISPTVQRRARSSAASLRANLSSGYAWRSDASAASASPVGSGKQIVAQLLGMSLRCRRGGGRGGVAGGRCGCAVPANDASASALTDECVRPPSPKPAAGSAAPAAPAVLLRGGARGSTGMIWPSVVST
eukprot:365911-Chlamydomonas_euryale.AAC.6